MNDFILPLDALRLEDAGRAGSKAAVLGTLKAAGFLVPDGFCLLAAAFQLALQPYEAALRRMLAGLDASKPETAEHTAAQIAELLRDLTIPGPVWQAVLGWLDDPAYRVPLAVRSSSAAEDLVSASFAGLYASVIGVSGPQAAATAILACWKSYFQAGALVERARHAPADAVVGMALLVQPVLAAECAGVCFSLDPIQPETQHVMVSAAWGLGNGVVDGTVTGDTYWLERRWQKVETRRVERKTRQVGLGRQNGLALLAVPEDLHETACLPDVWAERVAQQALAAEALLGCPQDVEWAVSGCRLWLLQSRPIASLGERACPPEPFSMQWEQEGDGQRLWRLHSPPGHADDIMLPLEYDDLRLVQEIRTDTCRLLGAERDERAVTANGRVYFTPVPLNLSLADKRLRAAAMDDLNERLYSQQQTTWDHYGPEIIRAVARLAAFEPQNATGDMLADHIEEAIAARRRHSMIHPMIRFRPARPFFTAFEALSGLSGREAETAAYQLIEHDGNILTRMIDAIYELAQAAAAVPGLPALVANPQPGVIQQIEALEGAALFLNRLRDFLALYGERNGDGYGSEGTLCTPTWRERPEEILRLAAPYLNPALPSPAERRKRARVERDQRLEVLCQNADAEAAAEFRRQLAYAGRLSVGLEEHNHYIDQSAYGQLRRAALLGAARLVTQGSLDTVDDVFWLTFPELTAGLRAPEPRHLQDVVRQRQDQHARWRLISAPPLLGLPDFNLPERPPLDGGEPLSAPVEPGDDNVISGLGASAGVARGRVRLVLDQKIIPPIAPGDVLVAVNAGPLWSPVFSLLGALVLDDGSLGQHAASTAREYGIPAVIAARDATRRLADGCWVTVDGTRGLVTLEAG